MSAEKQLRRLNQDFKEPVALGAVFLVTNPESGVCLPFGRSYHAQYLGNSDFLNNGKIYHKRNTLW
uniref:Uncharacterized protein n=1 Tax=Tetraselmis sp. GSL018 TaxID=582737 RepID=A0A061RTE6_9CHLO